MVITRRQLPQEKNTGKVDLMVAHPTSTPEVGAGSIAGHPEPEVKQVLRDGAAERVSDQDRRLGQRADEAVVVIDELVDADLGERGVRGRT